MTLEEVAAAKQALEAAGIRPSYAAIVARIGGSKRDVAAFMRALTAVETPLEEPTQAAPAPLSPLVQAKVSYTQALQAAAAEQAVQPRTREDRAQHLARLTTCNQILGQAQARWRAVELDTKTALAQLQYARAAQGRGTPAHQAHTQEQIDHATAQLQQLLATTRDEEALVQAVLDALHEPLVHGRRVVAGVVAGLVG